MDDHKKEFCSILLKHTRQAHNAVGLKVDKSDGYYWVRNATGPIWEGRACCANLAKVHAINVLIEKELRG